MFNIVNVNVEKVKESEVSMIPAPVIEFFNRYYGVDVSNVKIVYEDMDMELGYYNTGIRNTIHISNDVKGKGIKEEMIKQEHEKFEEELDDFVEELLAL